MNADTPGPAGAERAQPQDVRELGASFWIGLVIGGGIIAFGVRGVVTAPDGLRALDLARWVVAADVLHDLVLAPVAIAVGAVVLRCTPRVLRPPVRFGLVATGVVLLLGWAPWRGYGAARVPDNPTVQPLDYTTAILTVLAVVWGVVALWAIAGSAARTRLRRRRD